MLDACPVFDGAAQQLPAMQAKDAPVPPMSSRLYAIAAAALVLAAPAAAADPKAAFGARCGMCHQATGDGLAGQFPKLSGRAASIAASPQGRRYMARVILFGMAGPIEVEGARISGVMPGMATVTDADIADVLSHVITLGKPAKPAKPFKAAEIAAVRAEGKATMAENAALRAELVGKGLIK
jgi:mono/diheme cytochrome c family protein